jgi:hypothetical protein
MRARNQLDMTISALTARIETFSFYLCALGIFDKYKLEILENEYH